MLFRRPHYPICHDMRSVQSQQYFAELHPTDGSSVRSSDDGASGSPAGDDRERAKLVSKMEMVKEKLKSINVQREGDVEEFLHLSKEAEQQRGIDNPQMARILKQFEKKNKRYMHDTDTLQKKLTGYESRLAELESGCVPIDASRGNVISSVGHGIRRTGANIKGMTETVISAPMELANRIKNTFDSADNVNDVTSDGDDSRVGHSVFYASSEHGSHKSPTKGKSSTLPSNMRMNLAGGSDVGVYPVEMDDHSLLSMPATSGNAVANEEVMEELKKMRGHMGRMEDKLGQITTSYHNDLADLSRALDEERFKSKKLEDLLNETIELHQAEFLSLKQEQKNIANRLDYQYNDRFRTVEESLEAVQNQMCRMENSIKHSLDVQPNFSYWNNATVLSAANILVEFLKIFLYVVATVLDFFRIFTGSRNRAGILLAVLFGLIIVLKYANFNGLWKKSSNSEL